MSTSAEFCYLCAEWITCSREWDQHYTTHLEHVSIYCGIFTFRTSLVRPGFCPFCLGDSDLPVTDRFHQWLVKAALRDHLDKHFKQLLIDPIIGCPHPRCALPMPDNHTLMQHFISYHGIEGIADEPEKCDQLDVTREVSWPKSIESSRRSESLNEV